VVVVVVVLVIPAVLVVLVLVLVVVVVVVAVVVPGSGYTTTATTIDILLPPQQPRHTPHPFAVYCYLSQGVSTALCGARHVDYVRELEEVMALPVIPASRVHAAYDQVARAVLEITPTAYASESPHHHAQARRHTTRPPSPD
jgi:hypothetical protein